MFPQNDAAAAAEVRRGRRRRWQCTQLGFIIITPREKVEGCFGLGELSKFWGSL